MDDFNQMYKDVYDYWYERRDDSFSYNEIYDFLLKCGYSIKEEYVAGFRFNESVNKIFIFLTNQDHLRLFNDVSQFCRDYNVYFNERRQSQMLGYIDQLNIKYELVNIPYWGNTLNGKYKGKEDIYIISLKLFKDNWEHGLTLFEYYHHIRNVMGINLDNDVLLRIYRELTDTKNIVVYYNSKHLATTESIFRLLEYQELQQSLKESKEAKQQAIISTKLATDSIKLARVSMWIAIAGTIISSILAVIFGMNQWKSFSDDDKPMAKPVKKNIQVVSPVLKTY